MLVPVVGEKLVIRVPGGRLLVGLLVRRGVKCEMAGRLANCHCDAVAFGADCCWL